MSIQWQTLITSGDGKISLHRIRKCSTILMAWLGVFVLLFGVLLEAVTGLEVPFDGLVLVCGVLVVPMTGGMIADGIYGSRGYSQRFQQGERPDRRSGPQDRQ